MGARSTRRSRGRGSTMLPCARQHTSVVRTMSMDAVAARRRWRSVMLAPAAPPGRPGPPARPPPGVSHMRILLARKRRATSIWDACVTIWSKTRLKRRESSMPGDPFRRISSCDSTCSRYARRAAPVARSSCLASLTAPSTPGRRVCSTDPSRSSCRERSACIPLPAASRRRTRADSCWSHPCRLATCCCTCPRSSCPGSACWKQCCKAAASPAR
mmetsp:Transcript_9947/g.32240  ORF Transcript_9947/g.32240 Transcript_9947/m.32240 type:complete len:215 (-) Transcript_9947:71-715(-)